ncbi:alpha/beta fold hydrolase [Zunongwangia atlantica]|uniref:Alpha/beta hydrolase n=1 Tax=Zunongwangia atlantica 22II14-10F7 TaxID=1185767 RepID=A0A1Y1T7G2_9FLAO|nr:alpha/beta hydrolase [Zunongwangia atlantica]ORL47007.1 alpha/beta hydrolase [Zunongwangia atlantica 22II14-10F7]
MKKIPALFLLFSVFLNLNAQEVKELGLMLENYEYPYPVSFYHFNAQKDDYKMAYMYIQPENDNGKTVTLLHGKNFNGAYWETTIDALTKEGFNVLVPDQLGFGKSSKPKYFQYTFQQLAENTKGLIDSLGIEETTILGHSMGGMLATRFTLMYPEVTKNLVLVNPIGLEDWKLKVPYQSVDDWYKNEIGKTYEDIKNYQKESYYAGDWNQDYAKWAKLLAGWTLNENYDRIAWNSALTYDMIFTQPVVYEFSEISVPTLLIIGTRDRTALGKNLVSKQVKSTMGLYDKLGRSTQDKIPNAQLVEIPDTGHLPHIEVFDKFMTPLLEYLEK